MTYTKAKKVLIRRMDYLLSKENIQGTYQHAEGLALRCLLERNEELWQENEKLKKELSSEKSLTP